MAKTTEKLPKPPPLSGQSIREAYMTMRRSIEAWIEVTRGHPDALALAEGQKRVFDRLTKEAVARADVTPGLQSKKDFKPLARPSGKMMGKQKREAKDG